MPGTLIDNCHEGWDGAATLTDRRGTTRIASTGTPFVHLYAPPGEGYVCVEPVSDRPDAFNREDAPVARIMPGQATAIAMDIGFQPG